MKILIVDDEPNILIGLGDLLVKKGYLVKTAKTSDEAKSLLQSGQFDLLLTDFRLPGEDGIQLGLKALEKNRDLYVIIMTAYGTVEGAVSALKKGIYDYLTKPLKFEELLSKIEHIRDQISLRREVSQLRGQVKRARPSLYGNSSVMQLVHRFIHQAAHSQSNVLLLGETGTGKSLVAKIIHEMSTRASKPFVLVNCAALAPTLIESELFGHVRGAYTGADQSRRGKLLLADSGTLFLDEIGATNTAFQVKLLTFLQEKTFEPVGSDKSYTVDVRVIAATNTDIAEAVRTRRFREDLYFRLKVLSCKLPSLRERRQDIPGMAQYFLDRLVKDGKHKVLSPLAFAALETYPWPGNVRELQNAMEAAFGASEGEEIFPEHFSLQLHKTSIDVPSQATFSDVISHTERSLICDALSTTKGNVTKAAQRLGVNERSLRRKMQALGIQRSHFVQGKIGERES